MNENWSSVRRVLAIRTDSLGDVLMTTPAIRALHEGGCRVTLLASPHGALVAPFVPEIADTIAYDAPWMPGPPRADGSLERALVRKLRGRRFDAAVIFGVHTQDPLPGALLALAADIPRRLAFARRGAYGLLTDAPPDPDSPRSPGAIPQPPLHEVARQLALVGSAGFRASDDRLSFEVPRPLRQAALRRLSRLAPPGRPVAVVHPGARAASRRYPADAFGEVCALLRAEGIQPVLVGSRDHDEAELRLAARRCPGLPVITGLTLGELGALIQAADVFIGNNSGPAHISAAVHTPCVVLYAGTNFQHEPWRVECRVLRREVPCAPCLASTCPAARHPCLDIDSADVAQAALELLSACPDRAYVRRVSSCQTSSNVC
ncbi:MAG: glycosyltransferase family 9 protein [Coriobacteriia bacterium]